MELEENPHRKDLTAYERSKNMADLAEAVGAEAAEVVHRNGNNGRSPSKNGRGRPKILTSSHSVAARTGIPKQTLNDAKQHVAAVEKYPIFKSPDWTAEKAIATRKRHFLPRLPLGRMPGMTKHIKESASVHFQLLIAGSILFIAVFFWVVIPGPPSQSNNPDKAWCIICGLSAIAGYLVFVVLVAGHALLEKREPPQKSDQPAPRE